MKRTYKEIVIDYRDQLAELREENRRLEKRLNRETARSEREREKLERQLTATQDNYDMMMTSYQSLKLKLKEVEGEMERKTLYIKKLKRKIRELIQRLSE